VEKQINCEYLMSLTQNKRRSYEVRKLQEPKNVSGTSGGGGRETKSLGGP